MKRDELVPTYSASGVVRVMASLVLIKVSELGCELPGKL